MSWHETVEHHSREGRGMWWHTCTGCEWVSRTVGPDARDDMRKAAGRHMADSNTANEDVA